jgi:hypothetical protein
MVYHHKLTVHSISHTSVPRDTVSEILDLKRSLQTASKESSERGDERCERCKNEDVELNRRNSNRIGDWKQFPKRID